MSYVAEFLDRVSKSFKWHPLGGGQYLLTGYMGEQLEAPVKLHLYEDLFNRYVEQVARSEDGDTDAAVGLIYIHLAEEVGADNPDTVLAEAGVKRRPVLRTPEWFWTRLPLHQAQEQQPRAIWLVDPPPGTSTD